MSQKTSMSDGMIDGLLAKRLWDDETANASKSGNYVLGEMIAGATQPLAYYCAFRDWTEKKDDSLPNECFVATAVYGDINAPQVQILREFRDEVLQNSSAGRAFTNFYYSGVGKKIANFVSEDLPSTIPLIRKGLDFLVQKYEASKR
jgi:hypothetical protein